jgi:hypothetical protein
LYDRPHRPVAPRHHGNPDPDIVPRKTTNMTTQVRPAGWYPDPNGEPGQVYWDGHRWHKDIPGTRPPAASPTPGDQVRPHLEQGRRFWSGLSPQRQIVLAIAALLVAVAAVAVPIIAFNHFSGGWHSPSYQAGYTSGSSGAAHLGAMALGNDFACQTSLASSQLSNPNLVAKDYTQGCLDGLRDHPAG